jgi:predicted house-cleaning noncanonical NTP pyrophosphatase (MazG superfamily)
MSRKTYERFAWCKLVRDKVITHCREQSCRVTFTQKIGMELLQLLVEKLVEESHEIGVALNEMHDPKGHEKLVGELADLQTVLDTLCQAAAIGPEQVQAAQRRKAMRKGTFSQRHYIETIDVPVGHPMIPEFKAEPAKYRPMGRVR